MPAYEFRSANIPGVVIADDRQGSTQIDIGAGRHLLATWGGVMDVSIAQALKPWAVPVQLGFTAYRVGPGDWQDLEQGRRLWGCMLRGPAYHTAVFALLDHGWPVVGKGRG